MFRAPGGWLIAEQGRRARIVGDGAQGLAQGAAVMDWRRKIERQVDRVAMVLVQVHGVLGPHERGPAHEGAAPDLAGDQAAALRLRVSPAYGSHGHPQAPSQVPVGGQAIAPLDVTGGNVRGQSIGDGLVAWSGPVGEIGQPICHDDNYLFDTNFEREIDLIQGKK